MRQIPASLAILGVLTIGLVGCSQSTAQECPRPQASASAVTDLITVSDEVDEAPEVELYTPFVTTQTAVRDQVRGEGAPITTDDQLVVLDVSVTGGQSGDTLVAAGYDGDLSRVFPLSRWTQIFPAFEDALQCATEGSRIVVALAPGDVDPATASSIGLGEDESAVAVVDVRKVYLAKADGADQFVDGAGLPTVVRAPDGRPGIVVPETAPPAELVVRTIKKGTGPVVTGDEPVRVHYTGLTWADRTVFESTWDGEPQSVTLETMIPGFAEALEGQTVGSQVLMVIPPDQGYGDTGQGPIPANATLVFVVDILGLDQPAQR